VGPNVRELRISTLIERKNKKAKGQRMDRKGRAKGGTKTTGKKDHSDRNTKEGRKSGKKATDKRKDQNP